MSETFLVGNVDSTGRHLVNVTRHCRDSGIAVCGPGQPISVIGETIRYDDKAVCSHKCLTEVAKPCQCQFCVKQCLLW